jgi:hypothetical protein
MIPGLRVNKSYTELSIVSVRLKRDKDDFVEILVL